MEKTAILAISDAQGYEPEIYFEEAGGKELSSKASTGKFLGFTFGSKPNVTAHIDSVVKKTRRKLWILRHLRAFGFSETELVEVYTSIIRAGIEFSSVVYHSMLTGEQVKTLERLQYQSLKCIFGLQLSYRAVLEAANLQPLSERRELACEKFAKKCVNGKYSHWFPLKQRRPGLREQKIYLEQYARCDRLRNTPVFYMRRLLNKAGYQREEK
jgi:hypothetical protein